MQAAGNEPPAPGTAGDYWLRAIVSSLPSENNNKVKIRLESNTTSGAFIDSLGFRIHGYAGGAFMECSPGLGSGACPQGPTRIPLGNSVNPKSWGHINYPTAGQVAFPNNVKDLDLQIFLPTSNKADRFDDSEPIEFSLTSSFSTTDPMQPSLLHAVSDGAAAAAKIQGYEGSATLLDGPPSGGGSAPVPGPIPVLGAAGAFKLSRLLRRRLRSAR